MVVQNLHSGLVMTHVVVYKEDKKQSQVNPAAEKHGAVRIYRSHGGSAQKLL